MNFKLPSKREIDLVFSSFSKREWVLFGLLLAALVLSTVFILQNVNRSFMVSIPMRGGRVALGIIGAPRFINPILANTEADESLSALIYSGLLRKSPDGSLIPDLAESYETSPDGLSYAFTIKDDVYFQDGKPVTADDIIFTVSQVKDSVIKSPHKAKWEGISVEKIDAKTVQFALKQPYALFLENATIGILPAQLWADSPLELNPANTNPVGTGPYMVGTVGKKSSGVISHYELVPFEKFILGRPYVQNINLYFYQNEDDLAQALEEGAIQAASSIAPEKAGRLKEKNYRVESSTLPRVFGLFFNQNVNQLFTDKAVTRAISEAIDKNRIVREVLSGYGQTIDGPIPPGLRSYEESESKAKLPWKLPRRELLAKIQNDLTRAGWKKNETGFLEKTVPGKKPAKGAAPAGGQGSASGGKTATPLEFSISTGNIPELVRTAEFIKEDLAEIGMKVEIKTFETGNLNQNVIRPRKYDALLFGEIINHESDLFSFWHSSQRKDPGLNIAMYTNAKVNGILESAATALDEKERTKKYGEFQEEIKKDIPAVFLYSPDFIYAVPEDLKNFKVERIVSPRDLLWNAYSWYLEEENVWKVFARNTQIEP